MITVANERFSIEVSRDGFTLREGDRALREGAVSALRDQAVELAVCETLGYEALAEALAAAVLLARERPYAPPPPEPTRPSIQYSAGFGRGNPIGFWLLGRTLRVSTASGAHDLAVERAAADGVPAAWALPAALAELAEAQCRARAPLPCACGTGAPSPMHHGTAESLARAQDPRASCECEATVCECSVCGVRTVFTREGDTHYELYERSRPSRV